MWACLVGGLFFRVGIRAAEPLRHALAVVLGGVRPSPFAAEEDDNGIGAGRAKGAAAELDQGHEVEALEEYFAGADVGARRRRRG